MRDYIEELSLPQAVLVFSSYQKKEEMESGALSVTGKAAAALRNAAADKGNAAAVLQNAAKNGLGKAVLSVQYNPKSLDFQASSSDKGGGDLKNSPKSGNIHMSVELVFAQSGIGDFRVAERMELLFSIMLTDRGKHVEFYWANFHVKGTLTSFQGVYDMFDAAGNPVSGKMTLGIDVLDGTAYTED